MAELRGTNSRQPERASDRPSQPGQGRRQNLGIGDGYDQNKQKFGDSHATNRDLLPSRKIRGDIFTAAGADEAAIRPPDTESENTSRANGRNRSRTRNKNSERQEVQRRNSTRRVNRQDPNINLKVEQKFKEFVRENTNLTEVYDSVEEAREKIANDLKSPKGDDSFPVKLFIMAVAKDVGDFGDTILIGLAGFVLTTVFIAANYIYIRRRLGLSARAAFRFLAKRIAILLLGYIPYLNFLPEASVMIFLVHNRHKKLVQNMVAAYSILDNKLPKISG